MRYCSNYKTYFKCDGGVGEGVTIPPLITFINNHSWTATLQKIRLIIIQGDVWPSAGSDSWENMMTHLPSCCSPLCLTSSFLCSWAHFSHQSRRAGKCLYIESSPKVSKIWTGLEICTSRRLVGKQIHKWTLSLHQSTGFYISSSETWFCCMWAPPCLINTCIFQTSPLPANTFINLSSWS